MHLLRNALEGGAIDLHCRATNLGEILRTALDAAVAQGKLAADRVDIVLQALLRREQEGPAAIGQSVAVPHA